MSPRGNSTFNLSANLTLGSLTVVSNGSRAGTLTAWFTVITIIECLTSALIFLLISAIIYRHGKLSESRIQTIHMLLLEFVISSVVHPTLSLSVYFPELALSKKNCHSFYIFYIIIAGAEQWSTFILSVNRFIAIMLPHHYSKVNNRTATVVGILTGWIIMTAWTLPMIIDNGWDTVLVPPWNICVLRPITSINAKVFQANSFFGIYIPVSGTISCYVVVLVSELRRKLGKRRITVEVSGKSTTAYDQNGSSRYNRRTAAAKMLFASSVWYLMCYLPHIIITIFYYHLYVKNPHLQLWMRALFYSGYTGTPIIFFLIGKEYRTGLQKFCCSALYMTNKSAPSKATSRSHNSTGRRNSQTKTEKSCKIQAHS